MIQQTDEPMDRRTDNMDTNTRLESIGAICKFVNVTVDKQAKTLEVKIID